MLVLMLIQIEFSLFVKVTHMYVGCNTGHMYVQHKQDLFPSTLVTFKRQLAFNDLTLIESTL